MFGTRTLRLLLRLRVLMRRRLYWSCRLHGPRLLRWVRHGRTRLLHGSLRLRLCRVRLLWHRTLRLLHRARLRRMRLHDGMRLRLHRMRLRLRRMGLRLQGPRIGTWIGRLDRVRLEGSVRHGVIGGSRMVRRWLSDGLTG